MDTSSTDFGYLSEMPVDEAWIQGLKETLPRTHPGTDEVRVLRGWRLPFYVDAALLQVEGLRGGRSLGRHILLCLHGEDVTLTRVLDVHGRALDALERIVSPVLADVDVILAYVRFRLGFLNKLGEELEFGLAKPLSSDDVSFLDEGLIEVRSQLYQVARDRPRRSRDVVLQLRSGEGMVFVRTLAGWTLQPQDAAEATSTSEAADGGPTLMPWARVAGPHFVSHWDLEWVAPEPGSAPGNEPEAPDGVRGHEASAVREVPEPAKTLMAGFRRADASSATVIRSCPLRFYRTFKLYEIALLDDVTEGVAVSGYALARPVPNAPAQWEVLHLDGTSLPIHTANAAKLAGDEVEFCCDVRPPDDDKLGGPEDAVAEYIRFFCWAVEAQDGAFLTPSSLDRLEWLQPPSPRMIEVVKDSGLLPRMQPPPANLAQADGESAYRIALVIYARAVFRAMFKVTAEGMIDMLEDTALTDDPEKLPLDMALLSVARRCAWIQPEAVAVDTQSASTESPPLVAEVRQAFTSQEQNTKVLTHFRFEQAEDVWPHLAGAQRYVFKDCQFLQGLDLSGWRLAASLTFDACVFDALKKSLKPGVAIDMSELTLDGSLRLDGCLVKGGVVANDATIHGHLAVHACALANHWPPLAVRQMPALRADRTEKFQEASRTWWRENFDMDLSDITVKGTLRVGADPVIEAGGHRTIIAGKLLLTRAHLQRELILAGLWCSYINVQGARVMLAAQFGAPPYQARDADRKVMLETQGIYGEGMVVDELTLVDLRIGREVPFIPWEGFIAFRYAKVAKDVMFRRVWIDGDVSFYGAHVDGNLHFTETKVSGGMSFIFAYIKLFLSASTRESTQRSDFTLQCAGAFELSGARVGGLELSGVDIQGDLTCTTGEFGCFYVYPAVCGEKEAKIHVTRVRQIRIGRIEVKSDVRLYAVLVGQRPDSLMTLMEVWLGHQVPAGIEISNSDITGSIATLPEQRSLIDYVRYSHASLLKNDGSFRRLLSELESSPNLLYTLLRRDVIGNLHLRGNRIGGSVVLLDVTVQGRLVLADCEVDIDVLIGPTHEWGGGAEAGLQTQCTEADLEKLVCKGDIDLSGLSIHKQMHHGRARSGASLLQGSGKLNLRDGDIKGDLRLYDQATERHTQAEGMLDLSSLKANRLLLTGRNSARHAPVILERAQVSWLNFVAPPPATLDLTAIEVARWSYAESARTETLDASMNADQYIQVLNNMDPFDRGVWISVEAALRTQGDESEANQVYRAMRRRARPHLNGLRRAIDRLSAWTLSYGTRPWMPLLPLLLAFAVLVGVFSQPINVSPSSGLVQAHGGGCMDLVKSGHARLSEADRRWLSGVDAVCERMTPVSLGYSWTTMDGLYLAVRHSVPLINVLSHDDWQAPHRGIVVALPWTQAGRPVRWMLEVRVDALASLVSLYAWVAVPISLLFFGTKVFRGQRN